MTINTSDITAVILAGGQGRRLGGQDKGWVEYQGKPLIEHVLALITPQVSQIIINANRNLERYKNLKHTLLSDTLSDFQGPLAGFATAMQACQTDYLVTAPCDGPHLSADYVARLCAANPSGAHDTIVVAHDGERLQPVHALLPVALLPSLNAFLATGERKIDRWYAQHNVYTADFSDQPQTFFNINTEAQRQQGPSTDD